ncbi:MAG: electron transfer flavoprotein subunit alpha/FixB family protein [Chlorobi bacterium]|nr:electron transfer flavoprotein subunit alpha/FixB family protein [Chlorobiota bacterium]
MRILAFAEQRDRILKKNAFEAVTAARQLASTTGGSVIAVIVGSGIASQADQIGEYGVSDVVLVEDNRLGQHDSGATAKAIAAVAEQEGVDVVVISHTSHGKDLAPRVAVKLGAGYVPDAVGFGGNGADMTFARPVYAGKGVAEVSVKTPKKVVSIRPNVFTASKADSSVPVASRNITVDFADADFTSKVVETRVNTGKKDVADSDIIVSGGRGLKGPENFYLVENLAEVLDAAVGASRAVVDAGWRPHAEQVGQTGKTVSPTLYVACAISGAVQHLAGMSGSKYIVSINKDKDAPIFGVADYGIVGDVFEVLPVLTEEIRAAKN